MPSAPLGAHGSVGLQARFREYLLGCGSEVGNERDIGEHGDFHRAHDQRGAVRGRRRVHGRNVEGDGNDAPQGARARLLAVLIERVELQDFAARRNARTETLGERQLSAIVANDAKCEHQEAGEGAGRGRRRIIVRREGGAQRKLPTTVEAGEWRALRARVSYTAFR